MVCTKCGQQLADNAVFCTACGQKVEAQQAGTPDNGPVYSMPQQPVYQQNTAYQASDADAAQGKKAPNNKLMKLAIIAGAAVAVLIIGIIVLVNVIKVANRTDPIFFVKNDMLMFKEYADAKKSYVIKDNINSSDSMIVNNIIYDKKQNAIYFFDNISYDYDGYTGTLYKANIKRVKKSKSDAVEKINTDVYCGFNTEVGSDGYIDTYNDTWNYYLKSNGTLFYTKYDDGVRVLYSYSGGNKVKVEEGIREYFVSKDGKRVVVYLREDGEDVLKCGTISGDTVKFDELTRAYNSGSAFSTDNLSSVFFTTYNGESVISCYANGESNPVDVDFDRRLRYSEGAYFYFNTDNEMVCYDAATRKEIEMDCADYIDDYYGQSKLVVSYDEEDVYYVTVGKNDKYEIGECDGVTYLGGKTKNFYAVVDDTIYKYTFDASGVKGKNAVYDIDDEWDAGFYNETLYILESDGGSLCDVYKIGNKKSSPIIKGVYEDTFNVIANDTYLYSVDRANDTRMAVVKYKKKINTVCASSILDYYAYVGKGKMLTLENGKLMLNKCKNGKRTLLLADVDAIAFAVNSDCKFSAYENYISQ